MHILDHMTNIEAFILDQLEMWTKCSQYRRINETLVVGNEEQQAAQFTPHDV